MSTDSRFFKNPGHSNSWLLEYLVDFKTRNGKAAAIIYKNKYTSSILIHAFLPEDRDNIQENYWSSIDSWITDKYGAHVARYKTSARIKLMQDYT